MLFYIIGQEERTKRTMDGKSDSFIQLTNNLKFLKEDIEHTISYLDNIISGMNLAEDSSYENLNIFNTYGAHIKYISLRLQSTKKLMMEIELFTVFQIEFDNEMFYHLSLDDFFTLKWNKLMILNKSEAKIKIINMTKDEYEKKCLDDYNEFIEKYKNPN